MKKIYEPFSITKEDICEILTKTITETSIKNNKALEKLNEKVLEVMKDKGMIVPYSASSLVNLFKLEKKSQFKIIKDPNSIRKNDFLINGRIPVNLYSNIFTFRDSKKNLLY